MNNYFESLKKSKQKWARGHSSLRLIAELQHQFPNVPSSEVEDDFFESMGDYPDPADENGGGDGVYF
jgi:hypothetical protein